MNPITVLIVEDEEPLADVYAEWLQDSYNVKVAYTGDQALQQMDDDVDVVLLDRRMPGISGDEILEEIRSAGFHCKVIMVTAVDPNLNILEMDFDDYLCKPVDRQTLFETLDMHINIPERTDVLLDEFFGLLSKLRVLEDTAPKEELEANEDYMAVRDRVNELGAELDGMIADFDSLVDTYRDIARTADTDVEPIQTDEVLAIKHK